MYFNLKWYFFNWEFYTIIYLIYIVLFYDWMKSTVVIGVWKLKWDIYIFDSTLLKHSKKIVSAVIPDLVILVCYFFIKIEFEL